MLIFCGNVTFFFAGVTTTFKTVQIPEHQANEFKSILLFDMLNLIPMARNRACKLTDDLIPFAKMSRKLST